MPYCQKCGAEISEGTNFCPKCGAALGPLSPRARREKKEKGEKNEKGEKAEKAEKHEKGEFGYIGPLIGGLILIAVGFMAYLTRISPTYVLNWGPILLIVVGIIILVIAIYAVMTAAGRSPKPL